MGKLTFDNTDCTTKDPNLSTAQRLSVNSILKQERELNCSVSNQIEKITPYGVINGDIRFEDYFNIARYQTFPSKVTVKVVHEYRPLSGGGVPHYGIDSLQDTLSRINGDAASELDQWFLGCTDTVHAESIVKAWSNTVSEKIKIGINERQQYVIPYSVLSYILKTGRNWNGPIGKFRLEITHKEPIVINSCFSGLQRISDRSYVFEADDFIPRENIEIIFLNPPKNYHE